MPTNIEIVARNYEMFSAGDIEGVVGAYADDGVLVHHGPESAAARGEYNKQDLGDYFSRIRSDVDIRRFDVRKLLADGETVVALIEIAFTARATGLAFEGSAVQVTTLREGLVERLEIFTSEPESLYQV